MHGTESKKTRSDKMEQESKEYRLVQKFVNLDGITIDTTRIINELYDLMNRLNEEDERKVLKAIHIIEELDEEIRSKLTKVGEELKRRLYEKKAEQ